MMSTLLPLQAATTSSADTSGMVGLVGGLIGIYAARRRYGKASFRDLSALAIIAGAGFGTLLLALFPLVAALRSQDVSTGYSFSYWVGTGIGGALFIGGPAALIARFLGPRKPSNAGHPPQ